jgi:hypothetical protein
MEQKRFLYQTNFFDWFDSTDEMVEEYRENLEANELNSNEINESEMYEYFSWMASLYWDDFLGNLPADSSDKTYLVRANIGRWNGRFEGGKVITGLQNAIEQIVRGEDDFEIYYEDKTLKVDTHNHDASSYFEIYELTPKGIAYNEKHSGFYCKESDREVHQHLRNVKGYSKNVKIF